MKTKTLLIIGAIVLLGLFVMKKEVWLVGTGSGQFAQCFNAQYANEDVFVTMSYKTSVPANPLRVDLVGGDAPASLDGTALQTKYVPGSLMQNYYAIQKPVNNYDSYLVKMGTFNGLSVGTRYCLVFSSAEENYMGYVPLEYTAGYTNSWSRTTTGSWQQSNMANDAYMTQVQATGGCVPDCACAANTCTGQPCSNGCTGTCAGTKVCTGCIPMSTLLSEIGEWKSGTRTMTSLLTVIGQWKANSC